MGTAAVGYEPDMGLVSLAARGAAATGGQALRAATSTLASARPADKPLHPRGSVVPGVLERFGSLDTGAAWLDEAGEDDVLVRQSRAVGLPAVAPDIFGLAVRVPLPDDRYGDLLFASTGLGRVSRFTLTASRSPYRRPLTTLLPYRTPAGAVLLAAVHRDERTIDLSCAVLTGDWKPFGVLRLESDGPTAALDAPISFDPLLNTLPGLENYGWVRRLREPSYFTARRSRRQGDR
jgi:hypothetical protein